MVSSWVAPEATRGHCTLPRGSNQRLHRPRAASYYEDADLVRQASLLAVSVSVSVAVGVGEAQAFLDGNRRTAYAVLDTFMRINGYAYAGEPLELARRLEAVGGRAGSLDDATDGFESWLRQHIAPV